MRETILLFILFFYFTSSYANKTDSLLNMKIDRLDSQLLHLNKEYDILNDSLKNAIYQIKLNDYKSFEVVEKVDAFYNKAWDKLIYLISSIGAIVVFVIPIILSRLQRRELKLNKEEFQDYVDKVISEFDKSIKAENDLKIKEFGSQLEVTLRKEIALLFATTNHLQGREYLNSKNYTTAIDIFIKSIKKQIESEFVKNIPISLDNIYVAIREVKQLNQGISDEQTKELESILEKLAKEYPENFTEKISRVRNLITTKS